MLSPRYLAGCSDELVELYSQLETDIVADMARRMAKLGEVTDATVWQAGIYRETGGLQEEIQSKLKKYDEPVRKKLAARFDEALRKSAEGDASVFSKAHLSEAQQQILEATVKKTAGAGIIAGSKKVRQEAQNGFIKVFSGVQRATMTIADSASSEFVSQCNEAYMKVVTGAFDYKTALRQGVDAMAEKGVWTVQYTDSGKLLKRTIEGALRTNIMTGINQTAQQITQNNCTELGCDLVEVSAHLGARPSHAEWQGKIYSLSGTSRKYPPFSVCRPGEADGICGVNCRHSYYPYFEGMDAHYPAGELDEMKEPKVTYNGREMTQYEGEQQQRYIERQIRKYKRIVHAEDTAGIKSEDTRQKLGSWQTAARDFVKQTGLRRDYSREYIGSGNGQPKALKPE